MYPNFEKLKIAMIPLIQKCRFRENFEDNDGTLTGYLLNFTFLNAKHDRGTLNPYQVKRGQSDTKTVYIFYI